MMEHRSTGLDFLHIFVLVGFAIAQPLYDILALNPEFFVSHKASPTLIIFLSGILSFGLPITLIVCELASRLLGERMRRTVHGIIVFGLSMLIFLQIAKGIFPNIDFLIIGMAFTGAILFFIGYVHFKPIRMFLTVLAPAVVIFPVWFLCFTPIQSLIMPPNIDLPTKIEINNPSPVVVVILDEFSLTSLLDSKGQIDRVRFPNIGKFADKSWWFPNAIAVAQATEAALPAILSGRHPPALYSFPPPIAEDYPQNLFTLLGGRYHLNVTESSTALCPDSLCEPEAEAIRLRGPMVFSDMIVIYFHLLATVNLQQYLPSLELQWAGFGKALVNQTAFKEPQGKIPAKKPVPILQGRDVLLQKFLNQIGKTEKPTLHFLHVLLPHAPYVYLASGHQYSPSDGAGPAGLKNDGEGWIGGEPLILTAYQRYLQQIGFIDRFIGQLQHILKTSDLYHDALIIITADHGVSFRQGVSRRVINKENARDILRIPMIVKLPGQREGKISQRLVSSVDILPTIVDILNIHTTWEFDGRSMVNMKEPPRRKMKITGVGEYTIEDLGEPPFLNWQIAHFPEHTALDDLVSPGPHPSLIGKGLSDLQISHPSKMKVMHPDGIHLKEVNPTSGSLPVLFWASILGSNNRGLPVAVALNGQIWATTQTSQWKESNNFFSVLLPGRAFKTGRNSVGVYLINQNGTALTPLAFIDAQQTIRVQEDRSGGLQILFPDTHPIPVETKGNRLRGFVDLVRVRNKRLIFEGWAADIVAGRPAASLLIFSGEQLVAQVTPENSRPDVEKVFQQEGLLNSGFRAVVPISHLHTLATDVRVIAFSDEQEAFHLPFSDEQKRFIHTERLKSSIRLQKENSKQLTLHFSDGSQIPVETTPKVIRGYLDRVSTSGKMFVIEGWAADIAAPQSGVTVLIFAGEQLVAQVNPENSRPDVARVFREEELMNSGFQASVPIHQLQSIVEELSVIVVSPGQSALLLQFKDEQKKFIQLVRQNDAIP